MTIWSTSNNTIICLSSTETRLDHLKETLPLKDKWLFLFNTP